MSKETSRSVQALSAEEARRVVGGFDMCTVIMCPILAISAALASFISHENEGTWAAWHG